MDFLDRIEDLSRKESDYMHLDHGKVCEEFGELNGAWLAVKGLGSSQYKNIGLDDLISECVDLSIASLSFGINCGASKDQILEIMKNKLDKWEEAVNG